MKTGDSVCTKLWFYRLCTTERGNRLCKTTRLRCRIWLLVQSHNNSVFVSDFEFFLVLWRLRQIHCTEIWTKHGRFGKECIFACTARMSRIRTRAQYCEYRFIHFRYRLIRGIMLCFNYKNGKVPFWQRWYHMAITLNQIAEICGVSRGTVIGHFIIKEMFALRWRSGSRR